MRHLSLLAAILISTPVCAADFTDTIEIPVGFAKRWSAPRPFTEVVIGNPDVVDAKAETNQELIISMKSEVKPEGGSSNIALLDEHGEQVANVLVTNPATQYQHARNAITGELQLYRNDDKCYVGHGTARYPVCVRTKTKKDDPAPQKRIVAPDAPKQVVPDAPKQVVPDAPKQREVAATRAADVKN
jgi:Flp pilus assembly secretin CpaC